ncbi:protein lifeguard 1 [Dermatophagoides farinae]|uniref:protein lifeguard 1 n=1 Tax=Dermatophagoides farinae TaxID=6954 RepID=UPI003F60368F
MVGHHKHQRNHYSPDLESGSVSGGGGGDGYSNLDSSGFTDSFSRVSIRNAFIRKVYGILAMQFAFTTLVILLIRYNKDFNEYFSGPKGNIIYIASLVGYLVIYFILMCCESCRRTVPNNYVLLTIFTFFMSITLGCVCLQYDSDTVMYAAGLTFIVCLLVSIFSATTSFDFTKWSWIMFIVLIIFFVAGIAMMFIQNRTTQIIYAAIGVVIFTIYLAIDTQAIMGGREIEISPEEYIMAVIQLYINIVNLFILILRLISLSRN